MKRIWLAVFGAVLLGLAAVVCLDLASTCFRRWVNDRQIAVSIIVDGVLIGTAAFLIDRIATQREERRWVRAAAPLATTVVTLAQQAWAAYERSNADRSNPVLDDEFKGATADFADRLDGAQSLLSRTPELLLLNRDLLKIRTGLELRAFFDPALRAGFWQMPQTDELRQLVQALKPPGSASA